MHPFFFFFCFFNYKAAFLFLSPIVNNKNQDFVNQMNEKYAELHKKFEDNFWSARMGLQGNCVSELTESRVEYNQFISDRKILTMIREHQKKPDLSEAQSKCLKVMEKTYTCYLDETEEATELRKEVTSKESHLECSRRGMELGYTDPKTGKFVSASAVGLGSEMSTNDDEATRKACYEGIESISKFVVGPLCELVKVRNKMAKANGYGDFYEYRIQTSEGMNKKRLFELLDDLESKTRPIMEKALKSVVEKKGESSRKPWNLNYVLSGDTAQLMSPYFPFANAVSSWARSFAALNISYNKSVMNLDLCDRQGKYSNGFCHWPVCSYIKPNGTAVPCVTNFTSLANPRAVGSGAIALKTLMHEGGHAAHFANVTQPSPFHSQERAPTSVAYAENQSMFLDSLIGDSDWLARYARSETGEIIPWELIEKKIRETHDYQVFRIRSMLIVPYFEKALYELPDSEVTPENVMRLNHEINNKIAGGCNARPVLAFPHILSDESACFYQAYILADMSVYQTREHFLKKYGTLTDNNNIGNDLANIYWKPGNSEQFLDLVKKMTGSPLTADAFVARYDVELETRVCYYII